MELKAHLIQLFTWNSNANLQVLTKIKVLPEKEDAVRFFSHLINSQLKWMARITHDPKSPEMDWWNPIYKVDELEARWKASLELWLSFLKNTSDEDLKKEVTFIGYDGGNWCAAPGDIALQLNFHSIHHRAQLQTIIRQQGMTPDFVDYIATKYRKLT